MKTLKFFAVLAIATGMMVTSCKKESSTPSQSATALGVKLQATNKSFSLLKSALVTTPSFAWDTSFLIVSKIEFEAEKRESEMARDSSEVHFEWDGPKKIDLFSLTSVIGDISLLSGVYHEISLKIIALKADAGASPVFYLSGTYTNSVDSIIPIVVIVNEDFEFKVKKEGSSIDATTDYTSLINVNLTLLMGGITSMDLNSATRNNGKIIISSTSNATLYSKINTNLSTCEESELSKGKESESGSGKGSDSGSGSGSGSNSGSGSGYGY
jgi:uncharacterized membrane protein YgcG